MKFTLLQATYLKPLIQNALVKKIQVFFTVSYHLLIFNKNYLVRVKLANLNFLLRTEKLLNLKASFSDLLWALVTIIIIYNFDTLEGTANQEFLVEKSPLFFSWRKDKERIFSRNSLSRFLSCFIFRSSGPSTFSF